MCTRKTFHILDNENDTEEKTEILKRAKTALDFFESWDENM